MLKSIIIVGAGGEGREVLDLIRQINLRSFIPKFVVSGFIDNDKSKIGKSYEGVKVLGNDDWLKDYTFNNFFRPVTTNIVLGIGDPKIKKKILDSFVMPLPYLNFMSFPNIVSYNAEIGYNSNIGYGNVIKSGVKITCNVTMGNFNSINRDVNIGHDCQIGHYNVINPGAILSGNCTVKNDVLIGTNATLIENKVLNSKCIVGAGAVVTKNVAKGITVVGVPARELIYGS